MTEFIPVVVFNNRNVGEDIIMLKFFNEKPRSNPVIHIID